MSDALETWVAEVAEALGVDDAAVDVGGLLGLTRDVAHAVARPAGPLTTFLVGLAAGRRGGDAQDAAWAARVVGDLLARRDPSGLA